MEKSRFITAEEMAKDLCVSKAHAYKLIRKMNDELESKGYLTIAGRVSSCLLYTSPSPRDRSLSRMPSSA